MTADEIRKTRGTARGPFDCGFVTYAQDATSFYLSEIAAQLAELNERLEREEFERLAARGAVPRV